MRPRSSAARVGAVGAIAVAAFVLAVPAAAAPSPGVIVFVRAVGVDLQELALFSVRPDGSGLRRLTPQGRSEGAPALAPDGKRIVALGDGIVIRTANGRLVRRIPTRSADRYEPSWSPRGRWIAYLVERCESGGGGRDLGPLCGDLWLVRPDGRTRRRLVAGDVDTQDGQEYAWSPDGRSIVFERHQPAGLAVVDVATGKIRSLGRGSDPAWSGSGVIAFARQRGAFRGSDLYVVRPDGTGLRKVCRAGSAERPAFSDDGRSLAFLDYRPRPGANRWLVRVVGADGRCRTVGLATEEWTLRWSPDGARLLWETFGERLVIGRADGRGKPRFFTRGTLADWG